MIILGLLIILLYSLSLFWLETATQPTTTKLPSSPLSSISLIIPFRNEGKHLDALFHSIKALDYPKDLLELILVNDHSLDNGPMIVQQWLPKLEFKTTFLELETAKGKKAAIAKAVSIARGELIVATDADCTFEPNWLRTYDHLFREKDFDLCSGIVALKTSDPTSLLSRFQTVEQAIIMEISRRSIYRKAALMANGANMAYRKQHFDALFLQEKESASGDDVFMLHAFKKRNLKICFNQHESGVVHTQAISSLTAFFSQRIRWASKSRHYQDLQTQFFGILVFLANASLMIALVFSILNKDYLLWLILGFGFKLLTDGFVFYRSAEMKSIKENWFWFFIFSLIYPFYAILMALLSLLFKPYWKGRKI